MIPIYPSFFIGDHNVCSFRLYIWLSFSTFAFICTEYWYPKVLNFESSTMSIFCFLSFLFLFSDYWSINWASSLPSFIFLMVFFSNFISTGFEIWAFIPAARECCISSENALAVMAIIGIVFACSCELLQIAFVAS